MKRSNIIILIMLLFFPLGMLVHNLALKANYSNTKARTFNKYEGDQRYYRELPSFSHIVVSGGARLKGGNRKRLGLYNTQVGIKVGAGIKPSLEYRLDVKPFLRTEVRNDTLFCWFEADNTRDWKAAVRGYREISIMAPEISSLRADSTHLEIWQLEQRTPIDIRFYNLTFANLVQIDVPKLDLVGSRTPVSILSGKIDTIRYELGDQMNVTANIRVVFGMKEQVKLSPNSSFNIIGAVADSMTK